MSDQPPAAAAPTGPPKKTARGSLRPVALVLLLAAGAGGYYAYVRYTTPVPPPANQLAALREFFARDGATLTLDPRYKDADGDLVADPPADPAGVLKVGDELTFCVVPDEDPEKLKADEAEWKDFLAALGKATGKKVRYYPEAKTTADQLAALRDGKLHVTAFNTGLVRAAVNTAGFAPLFAPADAAGKYSYEMEILVRADSPVRTPADLRGKTLGFSTVSSNSGTKAPIVILDEKFGLVAGRDYPFVMTGTLTHALADLTTGRCDAACVANDLYGRVIADLEAKGKFRRDQFRSVYKSDAFPPLCFGVPYNLPPDLRKQVDDTFREFRFDGTSVGARYVPQGKVKFAPVNYKLDWAYVRRIDEALIRLTDRR
jgi:phosphonate transport system substrate-binding protein